MSPWLMSLLYRTQTYMVKVDSSRNLSTAYLYIFYAFFTVDLSASTPHPLATIANSVMILSIKMIANQGIFCLSCISWIIICSLLTEIICL